MVVVVKSRYLNKAPVAQWIERYPPEVDAGVRVTTGALLKSKPRAFYTSTRFRFNRGYAPMTGPQPNGRHP